MEEENIYKLYYTYILISEKNGRYYVGHSNDLNERLIVHNSGKVKSTRSRGPWKCVYFEEYDTKTEANRRELEIKKKKSRKYIENLIKTRK